MWRMIVEPAHALDAAMAAPLLIGDHWRGASDVQR